jgi:hypothetical protein
MMAAYVHNGRPRCVRNVMRVTRRGVDCAVRVRSAGPACRRRAPRCRSHLDPADAFSSQADLPRRAVREIKRASVHEWSTVVDSHHHRPAGVRVQYSHMRTQWQRGGRRGQSLGIVSLAAAGAMSREARPVPRGDFGARSGVTIVRRRGVGCVWRRRRSEVLRGASSEQQRE